MQETTMPTGAWVDRGAKRTFFTGEPEKPKDLAEGGKSVKVKREENGLLT